MSFSACASFLIDSCLAFASLIKAFLLVANDFCFNNDASSNPKTSACNLAFSSISSLELSPKSTCSWLILALSFANLNWSFSISVSNCDASSNAFILSPIALVSSSAINLFSAIVFFLSASITIKSICWSFTFCNSPAKTDAADASSFISSVIPLKLSFICESVSLKDWLNTLVNISPNPETLSVITEKPADSPSIACLSLSAPLWVFVK